MPPFILEAFKNKHDKDKSQRIVFTKGSYGDKVRITDWQYYREKDPIDVDPLAIGKVNQHLSHYNRLGIEPDEKYVTTTRLMLEQIKGKEHVRLNPNKRLINYYTYHDEMDCDLGQIRPSVCPKNCAERYISTMQNSYRQPFFYKLQRLALPTIPFLKYRKLPYEEPSLSEYKFYDEGFPIKTRRLMQHKVNQSRSFNPCTGLYNDGSAPKADRRQCMLLNYEDS